MPLRLGTPTSILTRLLFIGRGISGTSNVQQTYIANKVPAMGCTFDPQQKYMADYLRTSGSKRVLWPEME